MTGRLTIADLVTMKKRGEKITMLTAYDFPLAQVMDQVGIDMLLVGDSMAQVIYGLESTALIKFEQMLPHAEAVVRASRRAMVIGDMPFHTYQVMNEDPLKYAQSFLLAGCGAVKLEWCAGCDKIAERLVANHIPVIGHVGLTPQTAKEMKVQGRDDRGAAAIIEQVKLFEKAGCFAIVLECVPKSLAMTITAATSMITIGIGAGVKCDGQVLVSHDVLGLRSKYQPKFSKAFGDAHALAEAAFLAFHQDVKKGNFPDDAHSYLS